MIKHTVSIRWRHTPNLLDRVDILAEEMRQILATILTDPRGRICAPEDVRVKVDDGSEMDVNMKPLVIECILTAPSGQTLSKPYIAEKLAEHLYALLGENIKGKVSIDITIADTWCHET